MTRATERLNSEELARYSRHILLDEIGVDGQQALKNAKALVIGAGGLGSPVAMYLAAAGIGTLGIADFDRVELHNLQRQLLHGTGDIDSPKTKSAEERLKDINPHAAIRLHEDGVTVSNAIELFREYDIIVDGSDNFGTRYLNNDAAFISGKPLIYGSIFKFEGQVSVFNASSDSPCYRCLFPEPPPPGSVPNCGEAGVLGALCGIVGSMQALEAIKSLLGIGRSLSGSLLVLETLSMRTRNLSIKKDPQCPLCGESPTIKSLDPDRYQDHCDTSITSEPMSEEANYPIEVNVVEAKRILDENSAQLVDVREPFEFDICAVEDSTQIPMNSIPSNLEKLSKSGPLLIMCHHGSRSMQVTRFLRQNGFDNAINIAGGINDWAHSIDNSLQRY